MSRQKTRVSRWIRRLVSICRPTPSRSPSPLVDQWLETKRERDSKFPLTVIHGLRTNEMIQWCHNNVGYVGVDFEYEHGLMLPYDLFRFARDADALAFNLAWGGNLIPTVGT